MDRLVATEILTSGFCNLNCKYCYIPKTDSMKDLHKKITKKISSDEYIKDLKKIYGKHLRNVGFWGTEPTLNLEKIHFLTGLLFKEFPELNEISFSTNMMTNPDILYNYIIFLSKINRKIRFRCQISLDGYKEITDNNRIEGASELIPKHLNTLVNRLNNMDLGKLNVEFRWKSTLTIENIKNIDIDRYFSYFKKIYDDFVNTNKNKNVKLINSCSPTIVVPGKYTSEDGKILAEFFKQLRLKGYPNQYVFRMQRIIDFWDELSTKPSMFTCSGGDSNLGLGIWGDIHLCHRTFYFDSKEYIESIGDNMKNWDVSHFERGNIDLINDKYIVGKDDEFEKNRFLYVTRNYHDFWKLKISYTVVMLKELARCGQVSREYLKNDRLCELFAIFLNTGLSCPMENLLNTGCIHFAPVSMIRVFGNGAFQEILKRVKHVE